MRRTAVSACARACARACVCVRIFAPAAVEAATWRIETLSANPKAATYEYPEYHKGPNSNQVGVARVP
jgi:hypothetical protein